MHDLASIVLYPPRDRMLMFFVMSTAMAAAGGLFARSNMLFPWERVVCVVASAFVALAAFQYFWHLVSLRPVVVVDQEGITDHSSFSGVGLIRWHEIAHLKTVRFLNLRFLVIVPHDLRTMLARLGIVRRTFVRLDRLLGVAISVPQGVIPIDVDELLQQIIEYKKRMNERDERDFEM